MQAALVLLQPLYFSRTPPPRAIIPDAHPLGTFENQDGRLYLKNGTKKSGTVNNLPLISQEVMRLCWSFHFYLKKVKAKSQRVCSFPTNEVR